MIITSLKAFLVAFIVVGSVLPLDATPIVNVGYIEFPPVFYTDSKGKPQGILIDLVGKVIVHAGYEWKAASYPTNRMISLLVNGKIDLWVGLSTIPAFKEKTLIGQSEIMKISLCSYTIGKKPPIKTKEDLKGKSVIILNGYSYGGWITFIQNPHNNIRYHGTGTHMSAFKMLKAKRADYLLNYKGPSETTLKNIEIPDLQVNEISAFGAYFVVSKKTPNAEDLLNDLEKAYQQLKKEGNL